MLGGKGLLGPERRKFLSSTGLQRDQDQHQNDAEDIMSLNCQSMHIRMQLEIQVREFRDKVQTRSMNSRPINTYVAFHHTMLLFEVA